jgi:predicted TIM-barrel fold metal-dependent hydrolase
MTMSRREVLRWLTTAPVVASSACRCDAPYPEPRLAPQVQGTIPIRPLFAPRSLAAAGAGQLRLIDAHAHFFNASDVPVRGFVSECLGHRAPKHLQRLLKALALIAEQVARRAPTAAEEMQELRDVVASAPAAATEAASFVDDVIAKERQEAARRVVDVIRGTEFEREFRRQRRGPTIAGAGGGPISADDVLEIVSATERRTQAGGAVAAASPAEAAAADADGLLAFLMYMLSKRSNNVQTYMRAYGDAGDVGIAAVYGALVDFDRWLDCPPRSSHDDQVELHALLAQLHGDFLRPLVAYNPWSDIATPGAGLARVSRAWETLGFAGVKIYPPTGFLPAGNAGRPYSPKRHPDLSKLDDAMEAFFARCARSGIPILAHAAQSNGRDAVHDEFGGPAGWQLALARASASGLKVSFGHFGGGQGVDWTSGFARLMHPARNSLVFADLGYWEELMCTPGSSECGAPIGRLKSAMALPLEGGGTVADRVMFATDWLMLSRVHRWVDYPSRVTAALRSFLAAEQVARVASGNAARFYARPASS